MVPESANFFISLHTTRSRSRVARLFGPPTWSVRKCGWDDYEIASSFAELIIEAESPVLMHGVVADVETNADQILAPLRTAGLTFTAECYGTGGELLQEWC